MVMMGKMENFDEGGLEIKVMEEWGVTFVYDKEGESIEIK